MAKTLLLDQSAWDLVLDASGSIALASAPYATAQDVASAVRTFEGECWYDTTRGMPYWESILGKLPPSSLIKRRAQLEALRIPRVANVETVITDFRDRQLLGQIQFTDTDGNELGASF